MYVCVLNDNDQKSKKVIHDEETNTPVWNEHYRAKA